MKRFICLVCALVSSLWFVDIAKAQFIEVNPTLETYVGASIPRDIDTGLSYGASIGLDVNTAYFKEGSFFVHTALSYMNKAFSVDDLNSNSHNFNIGFFEVPLAIGLKFRFIDKLPDLNLYLRGGLYFSMHPQRTVVIPNINTETDFWGHLKGDDTILLGFDVGGQASVGLVYKWFYAGLCFQKGFFNLIDEDFGRNTDQSVYNTSAFFTIGMRLYLYTENDYLNYF